MTDPLDKSYEELRKWGFAPGGYMSYCSDCGRAHTADKRAWRCLACAEKKVGVKLEADDPKIVEHIEKLEKRYRKKTIKMLSALEETQDSYIRALEAERKNIELYEILQFIDDHLTNLQPKITELVHKEGISVIDGYVNPVLDAVRKELHAEEKP